MIDNDNLMGVASHNDVVESDQIEQYIYLVYRSQRRIYQ